MVEEKDKTRTEITEKVKKRKKIPVVIPYVKGLSEPIRSVFKSYEVSLYFKIMNTLSQLLVRLTSHPCGPT